jgi:hypothetical protein
MNERTITITLPVGPEYSNLGDHLELSDIEAAVMLPLIRSIVRAREHAEWWQEYREWKEYGEKPSK